MKIYIQMLIILFTCFTSSATFSAPKIVVPTNTSTFQKTEKVTHSKQAKIGIENYARSSIEHLQIQTTIFHQNNFSLSRYLKAENSCAIHFQESGSINQILIAQFSKKENLGELENRAREVLDVFVNGTGKLLVISELKVLTGVMPTGNKLTNLSFSKFFKGFDADFVASLGSKYVDDLAKIKQGLDKGGDLTEGIVSEALRKQGYTVTKDLGKYGSNNGFDVVAYKGTLDNPTEILIIEGKQFKQGQILDEFDDIKTAQGYDEPSGLTLNAANPNTGLPTQMSMDWCFEHVADKLFAKGGDFRKLSNALETNKSSVERYVFAIDKSTGAGYFKKVYKKPNSIFTIVLC